MTDLVLPRFSEMMEEGVIVKWLKRDGEPVNAGEPLVEVETDKATVVIEAEASGILEILSAEDEVVAVEALFGRLREGSAEPGPAAAPAAPAEPAAQAEPAAELPARRSRNGFRASPLARRLAREAGLSLVALAGAEPGRLIRRRDVEAAISTAAAPRAGGGEAVALTPVQRTIARRMVEAHTTVPDFTVEVEAEMSACVDLRRQLKWLGREPTPTVNDVVVKAAAVALSELPDFNAAFAGERIERHTTVDVGVAVAAERSLLVPVVAGADGLTLWEIAARVRKLARAAQAGTIAPGDLAGGTFTVSNLGMFGVTRVLPMINPPQAAILGVGAIRGVPAVLDGRLVERPTMSLTLTCDHRVIYGAEAAVALARIRELLEHPLSIPGLGL